MTSGSSNNSSSTNASTQSSASNTAKTSIDAENISRQCTTAISIGENDTQSTRFAMEIFNRVLSSEDPVLPEEIDILINSMQHDEHFLFGSLTGYLNSLSTKLQSSDGSPKLRGKLKKLLVVLSLFNSSNQLNDLINNKSVTITKEVISNAMNTYCKILNSLISLNKLNNIKLNDFDYLLSNSSLVLPLTILISHSYRFSMTNSTQYINMLFSIVLNHLINPYLIGTFDKLFEDSNAPTVETFNKLWFKLLSHNNNLNKNFYPSILDIWSRFNLIERFELDSLAFLFKYNLNCLLIKISEVSSHINSIMCGFTENLANSNNDKMIENLSDLSKFLGDPMSEELIMIHLFIKNQIFLSNFIKGFPKNKLIQKLFKNLLTRIITKRFVYNLEVFALSTEVKNYCFQQIENFTILKLINSQDQNFKILFEIIDHNVTLELDKNLNLVNYLAISLSQIENSLANDGNSLNLHLIINEYGSTYSLTNLFIYLNYLVSKNLIDSITSNNSVNILPSSITKSLDFSTLPPIPKSNYMFDKTDDIDCFNINFKVLNELSILPKLFNCLMCTLKILKTVIVDDNILNHEVYYNLVDLEISSNNPIYYKTCNIQLTLIFSSLFSTLVLIEQLKYFPKFNYSIYFDYETIADFFFLLITDIFEIILKSYSTLAGYNLIKFLDDICHQDLRFVNSSFVLLEHLLTHTKNSSSASFINNVFFNNSIVFDNLKNFVMLFDNGDEKFDSLKVFAKMDEDLIIDKKSKSREKTNLNFSQFKKWIMDDTDEVDNLLSNLNISNTNENKNGYHYSSNPNNNLGQIYSKLPLVNNTGNITNNNTYNNNNSVLNQSQNLMAGHINSASNATNMSNTSNYDMLSKANSINHSRASNYQYQKTNGYASNKSSYYQLDNQLQPNFYNNSVTLTPQIHNLMQQQQNLNDYNLYLTNKTQQYIQQPQPQQYTQPNQYIDYKNLFTNVISDQIVDSSKFHNDNLNHFNSSNVLTAATTDNSYIPNTNRAQSIHVDDFTKM